jgi:hypothetical protein
LGIGVSSEAVGTWGKVGTQPMSNCSEICVGCRGRLGGDDDGNDGDNDDYDDDDDDDRMSMS